MTRTPTHEEFRAVGYTGAAAQYPMDELAIKMIAAWNGVRPDQLPEAFKYHPNQWSLDAWTRVAEVAYGHVSAILRSGDSEDWT